MNNSKPGAIRDTFSLKPKMPDARNRVAFPVLSSSDICYPDLQCAARSCRIAYTGYFRRFECYRYDGAESVYKTSRHHQIQLLQSPASN